MDDPVVDRSTVGENGAIGDEVAYWRTQIAAYNREAETWLKRSQQVIDRYADDRRKNEEGLTRFNVLWSNVQTLLPALYAGPPKPDVQRRFKDDDPIGRVASDVLERAIAYFVSRDGYSETIEACLLDYLLPGRCVMWHRYVPHMRDIEVTGNQEVRDDGASVTDSVDEDDERKPKEIVYEEVIPDYVHFRDFGHTVPARKWQEVRAVWRRVYLDRDELVERFGKAGKDVPLDRVAKNDRGVAERNKQATIYEIWDRTKKRVLWIHLEVSDPLDEIADPLRLTNFFPCPPALLANSTNDSLIPVPDYVQYQDQARELDDLAGRIGELIKALKVVGVYDAQVPALERILSEGLSNKMVPVENWAVFGQQGGMDGSVSWFPLEQVAKALQLCYEAEEKAKQKLYEITGIADIVRGASKASETATAQQLKGQWAALRIQRRQAHAASFVRSSIEIFGEIIAEHFQSGTLKEITGIRLFDTAQERDAAKMRAQAMMQAGQLPELPSGINPETYKLMLDDPAWDEVLSLLKSDSRRCFRIDIETDSIIKQDEQADKAARIEFLGAAGKFLQEASAVAMNSPMLAPLLGQMLMFGVRGFKVGKELESAFDAAIRKMEQAAANPQPKPDPEMMKLQAHQQLEQARVEAQTQIEQAKLQAQQGADQARADADMAVEQMREQHRLDGERLKQAFESQREAQRLEFERWKVEREGEIKILIAEMQADSDMRLATTAPPGAVPVEKPEPDIGAMVDEAAAQQIRKLMEEEQQARPLEIEIDPRTRRVARVNGRMLKVERDPQTRRVVSINGRPIVRRELAVIQ